MKTLKQLLKNPRFLSVAALGIVLTYLGHSFHWACYFLGVPSLLLVISLAFLIPINEHQDKKRKAKRDKEWAERQQARKRLNDELTGKLIPVFFGREKQRWSRLDIDDAFKAVGINTEQYFPDHDISQNSILKLEDIEVEWCDARNLISLEYNVKNAAFHGTCEIVYSWGVVTKNYDEGKLHGCQRIFVKGVQALSMTYAFGHFEAASFETNWGSVNCFASGQNKLGYRLVKENTALEFITSKEKPKMSWRRTLTDPDRLREVCEKTEGAPEGEVSVTLNDNNYSLQMQGFRVDKLDGIELGRWLGLKSMWSAWAFLYYDYRFCLGTYKDFKITYDHGVRGPPIPPAEYSFNYKIESLLDFFEVPGSRTHFRDW